MPDQHALLSASGAHRWLECPPSALLEAAEPDTSSPAADQGTVAHALAEHKLRRALKQRSHRPASTWIDDEMETYTDDYVAFVQERIRKAGTHCPDPKVLIEQRLDFSHIVPDGFGTGDAVIIGEPCLEIIDLKYGQGVLVEAENNPQLMLYALGALEAFGGLYEIEQVTLTIYQPRRANISTWSIPVFDLTEWADTYVKPRAALAAKGKGEFRSGAWCQFCKLAATCRARAKENLAIAQYEFAPPPELDAHDIADILSRIPHIKKWMNDVEDYALSQAINHGVSYEGFKLVAGRSIRKYADEKAVIDAAMEAGYKDIFDRKLISLTAMEKLMGKQEFATILGDLIVKPEGKPTLVSETDKRPAINTLSAADEFNNNVKQSN